MTRVLGGRWFGWAMVGATFWALPACQGESSSGGEDGDDEEPSGFCSRFATRLGGCGMGALVPELGDCEEPDDEQGRCETSCIVEASCDELRLAICTDAIPPEFYACLSGCQPPDFTCRSGEGAVPDSWVCDAFPDCADGSDEVGCPTFTCESGETLPEFVECDFYFDCVDGSDEHGECPGVFTCGNGDVIPVEWECDGEADCLDGSDEHGGCPSVTCDDGSTTLGARCDGILDCFDASDEPANCPRTPFEEACGTG